MKIGLFQYNPYWEDKEKNMKKIFDIFDKFYESCELICFPEMTLTGFSMKPQKISEELKGQTYSFFRELAIKKSVNLVYGFARKQGDSFFNTLVVLSKKGEILKTYDKIHLFSFAGENKIFTSGSIVENVEIAGVKIGLSVCYDLRFPELYRIFAYEKIKIMINIANWPDSRIEFWKALLKARAIENQAYIVGVNRIGADSVNIYSGCSSVYDPLGNTVLEIINEEGIFYFEPDFEFLEEVRNKYPFLNDMKINSLANKKI